MNTITEYFLILFTEDNTIATNEQVNCSTLSNNIHEIELEEEDWNDILRKINVDYGI